MLTKTKFNITEVIISNALTDSDISHDDSVSVNNVLREINDLKEEIIQNTFQDHSSN